MTACDGTRPSPLATVAFVALSVFATAALPSAACAQAAPASANAKPATPRAKKAAQRHLQRGNELFRRDEIAAALGEFQAAFDLYPSPKLHFNLGQCERALGHADAAATHFERFLADADDVSPELRAEAQRYLTEARPPVVPSSAPTEPSSPEPPAASETASAEPMPAAAPLPPAPPPRTSTPVVALPSAPPATPPLYKRWWFWAAVGAIVVGATVTTYALARPRDPDCGAMMCF